MAQELVQVTCGCTARPLYPLDIEFCPLHAHAGELKTRLKGLLEAQQGVMLIGGRHMGRSWLAEEWEKAQTLLKEIQNG